MSTSDATSRLVLVLHLDPTTARMNVSSKSLDLDISGDIAETRSRIDDRTGVGRTTWAKDAPHDPRCGLTECAVIPSSGSNHRRKKRIPGAPERRTRAHHRFEGERSHCGACGGELLGSNFTLHT